MQVPVAVWSGTASPIRGWDVLPTLKFSLPPDTSHRQSAATFSGRWNRAPQRRCSKATSRLLRDNDGLPFEKLE